MKVKIKGRTVGLRNVSSFVGRLRYKNTNEIKKCDACKQEDAMWAHETNKGETVYPCFGCGDH